MLGIGRVLYGGFGFRWIGEDHGNADLDVIEADSGGVVEFLRDEGEDFSAFSVLERVVQLFDDQRADMPILCAEVVSQFAGFGSTQPAEGMSGLALDENKVFSLVHADPEWSAPFRLFSSSNLRTCCVITDAAFVNPGLQFFLVSVDASVEQDFGEISCDGVQPLDP